MGIHNRSEMVAVQRLPPHNSNCSETQEIPQEEIMTSSCYYQQKELRKTTKHPEVTQILGTSGISETQPVHMKWFSVTTP
jgi:hypothetical protein